MENTAKHDLTTEQGRTEALCNLEDSFLNDLNKVVTLSPDTGVSVKEFGVIIGIKRPDKCKYWFDGEITLSAETDGVVGKKRPNEMNFGCSGAFTPENKASYWRTVHAANILHKWDEVSRLVNEYCKKYKELISEVKEIVKPKSN